jgi:hypothetical protein
MRPMETFDELSKSVDMTGTGSMRVVASRVAASYSCRFRTQYDVNLLHGKAFGSGTTN